MCALKSSYMLNFLKYVFILHFRIVAMQQCTDVVVVLWLRNEGGLVQMAGCLQIHSFYGTESSSCLDETPSVNSFWMDLTAHDNHSWCEDV